MYIKDYISFNESKSNGGFNEITFSLTYDDYKEIMFDIDIDSGKLIDLYCYADGIPMYYNYNTDKETPLKVRDSKNSLFKKILPTKSNIKKLIEMGAVPHLQSEKEYELVIKMLKWYDIDLSYASEWDYDE